ncbi:hypothetical protein ACFXPN_05295 [Streptomyces griseorubiginosus]
MESAPSGMRRARYRGLPKARLQRTYYTTALSVIPAQPLPHTQ